MDIAGGPAVLGGIMLCVALAAWSLGRWQGGLVLVEDRSAPGDADPQPAGDARLGPSSVSTTPGLDASRAEHGMALAAAVSLGDMRAEISAYRRAEQVLSDLKYDPLHLIAELHAGQTGCRYSGTVDTPTCNAQEAARLADACVSGPHLAQLTP